MGKKKGNRELYDLCWNARGDNEDSLTTLRQCLNRNKNNVIFFKEAASYKGEHRWTPLHWILFKRLPIDIVEILIQHAPETLRITNDMGKLPLHVACHGGSLDLIRVLMNANPGSIQARDRIGDLPLHFSCHSGASLEVLNLLIEAYPESIHEKNTYMHKPSQILNRWAHRTGGNLHMSFLHDAVIRDFSVHLIQLLLEAFPESGMVQDENGMTPLHHACTNNSMDVVIALLNANPESSTVTDSHGRTPSQLLKDAFLTTRDESGRHILHHQAARCGGLAATSLTFWLDVYSEGIEITDIYGMLPFHYACLNEDSSLEVLMMFVQFNPESIALCRNR